MAGTEDLQGHDRKRRIDGREIMLVHERRPVGNEERRVRDASQIHGRCPTRKTSGAPCPQQTGQSDFTSLRAAPVGSRSGSDSGVDGRGLAVLGRRVGGGGRECGNGSAGAAVGLGRGGGSDGAVLARSLDRRRSAASLDSGRGDEASSSKGARGTSRVATTGTAVARTTAAHDRLLKRKVATDALGVGKLLNGGLRGSGWSRLFLPLLESASGDCCGVAGLGRGGGGHDCDGGGLPVRGPSRNGSVDVDGCQLEKTTWWYTYSLQERSWCLCSRGSGP